MARYPSYQSTDIPWLPEIPVGWEVKRAKFLWRQITDASCSFRKIGLENIEPFSGRFIELNGNFEGNGVGFKKGDILYGKLRPYLAKVWVAEFDGNAVGDFFVYRLNKDVCCRYMQYHMLSPQFTESASASTYGAKMPRVSAVYMANQLIPVPPLSVQERIVAYLDKQTAKVDALIKAKTEQVALLKELRERTIADAVTRGLPGEHTSFQSTNIPWLPEIPDGWEMKRLKNILCLKKTVVGEDSNLYDLLSLTLRGVIKRDMENPEGKFPSSFDTYQVVDEGDFVFCLFDNEETPRTIGLSSLHGMITGAYTVMTPYKCDFSSPFLNYYLLYLDERKRLKPLYRGLRKTIPVSSLLSSKIPVPPLSEQERIVAYLDELTAKIDKAVALLASGIEHLKAYRERLIADVVTGQLKVE